MIPSYPMCYPSADKADLDMWPHKVYKFVASHSKKGGTAALFSAYQAVLDDIFRSHGPFVIEEICRKDSETVCIHPTWRALDPQYSLIYS